MGETTESKIQTAVFAQNNGRSHGADLLIVEVFKYSYDIILPYLLKLYQTIIIRVMYFQFWKLSRRVGGDIKKL